MESVAVMLAAVRKLSECLVGMAKKQGVSTTLFEPSGGCLQ